MIPNYPLISTLITILSLLIMYFVFIPTITERDSILYKTIKSHSIITTITIAATNLLLALYAFSISKQNNTYTHDYLKELFLSISFVALFLISYKIFDGISAFIGAARTSHDLPNYQVNDERQLPASNSNDTIMDNITINGAIYSDNPHINSDKPLERFFG